LAKIEDIEAMSAEEHGTRSKEGEFCVASQRWTCRRAAEAGRHVPIITAGGWKMRGTVLIQFSDFKNIHKVVQHQYNRILEHLPHS
jgi:hypothetical protein